MYLRIIFNSQHIRTDIRADKHGLDSHDMVVYTRYGLVTHDIIIMYTRHVTRHGRVTHDIIYVYTGHDLDTHDMVWTPTTWSCYLRHAALMSTFRVYHVVCTPIMSCVHLSCRVGHM